MAASTTSAQYLTVFSFKSLNATSVIWTAFLSFVVVAVFVLVKLILRRYSYSKGIPSKQVNLFSILGNFADFPPERARNGYSFNVYLLQTLSAYSHLFKKEKLYCFWISYFPFIVLKKAEAVEDVICGTKMMEKGWVYKWLHPWLGTGLLTSHGGKWKSRRKLLTPSFHFDILKDFLPVFDEQSRQLVIKLKQETANPWTDIVLPVTLCSLDIICETTLGVKIGAQNNSDSEYVKAVSRASEILMERMVNPSYWFDWLFHLSPLGRQFKKDLELLHSFTRSVINEKKTKLLCGVPEMARRKRKALMDVLLEHHIQNKSLTEEDIREEVDTFAFEGHDTTSMGMSWALYLIGLYPDVQANIHEELDRIFGDDVDRPITTDDLKDMQYLDRVLKESQRLYPSVPMFGRQANEEFTVCGSRIPKGSLCIVLTYHLHRDEEVFPNPEVFNPDRFLPENSAERHPYAYIPFSAGPRNCIGQRFAVMEEKVVISNVMRHYTLESVESRDKIPPATELILRASHPLKIKIRSRR
ncbi:cytochrome P450 4V2-like [Uloborus diversus]|uniref:cytochrome P450 4V2-like n=1 Tax=Uloborus diversus TaxID=327109 RepID=UPI0024091C34|nr:cytochrome P450 4V2-like [Uloborus diversus]